MKLNDEFSETVKNKNKYNNAQVENINKTKNLFLFLFDCGIKAFNKHFQLKQNVF